jgi:hypothetical protein
MTVNQENKKQQMIGGEEEPPYTAIHCWWECKLVQSLWKSIWRFLKKIKMELPYDPAIPLLRIFLKESKSDYNVDNCILMFIMALFMTWNYINITK